MEPKRYFPFWMILWIAVMVVFSLRLPGFSESDASKYMQIAEHMLKSGQYLIPVWHGHEYTDKPPLMFWLYTAGWRAFGVVEWWPQLLSLLFAAGSIFFTRRLAGLLWPQRRSLAEIAPVILLGSFYWLWFAKEVRVDAMLTLSVVWAWVGLLMVLRDKKSGWWQYASAIALGGFAKGPVMLIFTLIPALSMPWVFRDANVRAKRWFGRLALFTGLGLVLPLVWAVLAALRGGQHFGASIFYGQISKRAHWHQDSDWFYLLRLPLWLFPWTLYVPFWRGVFKSIKSASLRPGFLFCLSVLVIGLLVFSFFGQKLPHYMYPLFPVFALVFALGVYGDVEADGRYRFWFQWVVALPLIVLGGIFLLFPHFYPYFSLKTQIRSAFVLETGTSWVWSLVLVGLLTLLWNTRDLVKQVSLMMLGVVVLNIFINAALLPTYRSHAGPAVIVQQYLQARAQGKPIAIVGKFTDPRLFFITYPKHQKPPRVEAAKLSAWLRAHPNGWVLTSDMSYLSKKTVVLPKLWYYQNRYSIVSLHSAGSLLK